MIEPLTTATLPVAPWRAADTSLSRSDQLMAVSPFIGPVSRVLSYNSSTDWLMRLLTAPYPTPSALLALMKMGRPSRVFTNTLP